MDRQTDEQILERVKAIALGCYHPSGSCRIGGDDAAVVDSKLKVRGVKVLRVVDASIMPTLVFGNTNNAATTMMAGKSADLILIDYKRP